MKNLDNKKKIMLVGFAVNLKCPDNAVGREGGGGEKRGGRSHYIDDRLCWFLWWLMSLPFWDF